MSTGIVLFADPQAMNRVDDVVAQATRAYDLGVRQVWLSQNNDHDAIALAAVVGAAVPGLGVGTSVVPINPRHPLIVASLAQTAQAASHGNFSLGLGLGGHEPERQAFGMSWPNTITRLREHLTVLRSVFDTGAVDFSGTEITAQPGWPVRVAGGTPVPSPASWPTAPCRTSPVRGPSRSSSPRQSRSRPTTREGRNPGSSRRCRQ
jgi:alkanesulfonate monooxygenase SsuD/methylene tetrahydromethanopterin reductase-like flavin-dependent oxidoreductase (luciferase family)